MARANNIIIRDRTNHVAPRRADVDYQDLSKHPRHRIAMWVVIGVFVVWFVFTAIYEVHCWMQPEPIGPTDVVNGLKTIWESLIPLLTLVLGYEFGKSDGA